MSELVELQEITSPGGWNHVIRSERRRRELTLTELYIHTPTTFEPPETEAETLESSLYLSVVRDSCQDYGFPSSDFTPFKGGQSRIKDAAADFVDNNEIPGKLSRRSKVDFFANSLVPVVFSARLIGSKEFNDSRRAFLRHRFPGVIPVASRPSLIERFKDQPIHGSEVQAAADVLSEQTAIKTPYPDFLQLSPNQQASIINALGKEWQQLCALVQEHDPTLFTSLKYRTQSPLAYLSVEELRATIAENPQIRPGRLCAAFLESPRTFYDELPKLRQYRISDP